LQQKNLTGGGEKHAREKGNSKGRISWEKAVLSAIEHRSQNLKFLLTVSSIGLGGGLRKMPSKEYGGGKRKRWAEEK